MLESFAHEVHFVQTTRHRNILFFYGTGVDQLNTPFLVTEWMARGSLFRVLHDPQPDEQLSHQTIYRMAHDAALGLEFLHSLTPPVVHRYLDVLSLPPLPL